MQKIDNELPVICWFSAGVTSAVATKIALQYYSNVRIMFIGTGQEEHDSFRFIEDIRNRRYVSFPIFFPNQFLNFSAGGC